MKNIYISTIALLALIFNSCETYEGALTPNEFSDYTFICSGYTSGSEEMNYIDLNSVVSFMNLSKGDIAHYWEIEEGCAFVTEDYPDFAAGNYDSITLEGLISTEDTAHIHFGESGVFTVTLVALFEEAVSYQPSEGSELYESYYSEELGGYMIRTEFNFMALGDVAAAISVYKSDGTKVLSMDAEDNVEEGSYGSITITEDETLTVVFDDILSDPNSFTYNFNDGTPDVVETLGEDGMPASVAVTYRTPGSSYSMGSIILLREAIDEYEEMSSSKATKSIPLIITVEEAEYVESPIDLVAGSLTATTSSVSFEVSSLNKLYIGEDAAADFTLMVSNTEAGVTDKAITIVEATLSSDYTTVTLVLDSDDPLYTNDEITLSYSGQGINDGNKNYLTDFTSESVEFYESVIDTAYYDFETTGASWKSSKTANAWSYSDEQVHSGAYSMKYTNTEAYSGNTFNKSSDQYMVTTEFSQTYTLKFKAFVTEDSTVTDTTAFIFYTTYTYTKIFGATMTALENFEKGKWMDLEITFTNGSAPNNDNAAADDSIQVGLLQPDVCTVYFDQIDMVVQSSRPTL